MKSANTHEKIEEALNYMQNDTLKAISIYDEILEKNPKISMHSTARILTDETEPNG